MNHFVPALLPNRPSSLVCWATRPDGRLILFVHGFGGHTLSTWADFPRAVLSDPAYAGADVVFYGYDSKRVRAAVSSRLLYETVSTLAEAPNSVIVRCVGTRIRPTNFRYRKICIVSHSLGGAICRRIVADAYKIKKSWLRKITLILFAPAHLGADALSLATGAVLSIPGGAFTNAFARWVFPVLRDIEPASRFLQQLSSDTQTALLSLKRAPMLASEIIFGEYERVVDTNTFGMDPPPKVEMSRDHFSVCKPDIHYGAPLQYVRRFI